VLDRRHQTVKRSNALRKLVCASNTIQPQAPAPFFAGLIPTKDSISVDEFAICPLARPREFLAANEIQHIVDSPSAAGSRMPTRKKMGCMS
jgi:hypothetical protein